MNANFSHCTWICNPVTYRTAGITDSVHGRYVYYAQENYERFNKFYIVWYPINNMPLFDGLYGWKNEGLSGKEVYKILSYGIEKVWNNTSVLEMTMKVGRIGYANLPKEVQKRIGYDCAHMAGHAFVFDSLVKQYESGTFNPGSSFKISL